MKQMIPIPVLTEQQLVSFWAQVDKVSNPNGCWEWIGARSNKGYGYFGVNYKEYRVHRLSWKVSTGKDPELLMLHTCDNRSCLRPDHLFEGTHSDNRNDAKQKGRLPTGEKHFTALRPNAMPRGESHPHAKMTVGQVIQIRLEKPKRLRLVAKKHGVSFSCIQALLSGKTWSHVK